MMQWIHKFDLFLCDFDGLLVNTEELHFLAYREMCQRRGYVLTWDLPRFFEAAHFKAAGLKEALYAEFPRLQKEEPKWETLYAEKKKIYQEFLLAGKINLMPGAYPLLEALQKNHLPRCVVTNSLYEQVEVIKKQQPILQTIPLWITREDYKKAKPSPDGYVVAIESLGKPGDKVIGFEDSTRGLQALLGAKVTQAVLISSPDHPQMEVKLPLGVRHFTSLADVSL
jgi:HAD superfamily hydrolase (TIGR01509 family)